MMLSPTLILGRIQYSKTCVWEVILEALSGGSKCRREEKEAREGSRLCGGHWVTGAWPHRDLRRQCGTGLRCLLRGEDTFCRFFLHQLQPGLAWGHTQSCLPRTCGQWKEPSGSKGQVPPQRRYRCPALGEVSPKDTGCACCARLGSSGLSSCL